MIPLGKRSDDRSGEMSAIALVWIALFALGCHDEPVPPEAPAPPSRRATEAVSPSEHVSPRPAPPATPADEEGLRGPGSLRERLGSEPPCGLPACDVPDGDARSVARRGHALLGTDSPRAACISVTAAERAIEASDDRVAGATLYDAGRAFEQMGCPEAAVACFAASLCVRPPEEAPAAARVLEACQTHRGCGGPWCEDDTASRPPSSRDGAATGTLVPDGEALCEDCRVDETRRLVVDGETIECVFVTPPSGMAVYVLRREDGGRRVLGSYHEDFAGAGIPTEVSGATITAHEDAGTHALTFRTRSCNRDTEAGEPGDCRTYETEIGFSSTHAWVARTTCVEGDCLE